MQQLLPLRTAAAVSFLVTTSAITAEPVSQTTPLTPRIDLVTCHSSILGCEKQFVVVKPIGYTSQGDNWPVVFLLHGKGRHERTLVDDDTTRKALLDAPFVTVLPDGDTSWWIDSPANSKSRYESYLEEVIRIAESAYNLSLEPARRGLAGWSMGAYGATRFATRHADRFAALATAIGVLDYPSTGNGREVAAQGETGIFGTDQDVWTESNPLNQAENLRNMKICLITGDTAFDRPMNEAMHRRLDALQIPHDWHILKGGHTFAVVTEALPLMLQHLSQALSPANK